MNLLVALLLMFTPVREDCGPGGLAEMRELYLETMKLMDQIELEAQQSKGKLTDEAVELWAELRDNDATLKEWVRRCRPIVPRRSGL